MLEMLQEMGLLVCFGSAVLFAVFSVVLTLAYWQREKREGRQRTQQKTNISDITILFQTMRDVITQQKNMAREFNQELDTKMALVKQVLSRSVEKNERLYDKQQQIQKELDETRAQLASVQRQAAYLQEALDAAEARAGMAGQAAPSRPAAPPKAKPVAPPSAPPPPVAAPATTPPAAPTPRAEQEESPKAYVSFDSDPPAPRPKSPPPRIDTMELPFPEDSLEDTGLTEASYSKWVGTDFEDAPREVSEAPYVPEAPEDAQAARDAFRALLDIDGSPPVTPQPAPGDAPTPGNAPWHAAPAERSRRAAAKGAAGNGRGGDPLQRRVLEYHDAGMSIPEIAKELGVGKGEVRLLLSLAQQRRR